MEEDNDNYVIESQNLKHFHFYNIFNFGFIQTLMLSQEDADSIQESEDQKYTFIEPPIDVPRYQKAVFDDKVQTWKILENNYGCLVYSISNGHSEVINYFGQIKEGFTFFAPNTEFDTWNGEAWEDRRTEDEKQQADRRSLPDITARQFKLMLLENDLTDYVEETINSIQDKYTRRKLLIEYKEASYFERNGEAVVSMIRLLNISDVLVDKYWREATSY